MNMSGKSYSHPQRKMLLTPLSATFCVLSLFVNFNLLIADAPRQTSFSSNILNAGDLGKPTTFMCSAKGNPQISYQIYKEGSLLSNTTTGIYVINSTTFNDSGLYWCIPVNYLGEGPKFEYNFTVYGVSITKLLLIDLLLIYLTFDYL